jgi:hypothetical protein
MEMTRDQLLVFYLVLNRKEMLNRELLDLGYNARTIRTLATKGLLQLHHGTNGELIVHVTNKSLIFESQIRVMEAKHPNVNQEGHGTYMIKLAKMVQI